MLPRRDHLTALCLTGLGIFHAAQAQTDLNAILTDPANEWDVGTIVSFPGTEEFVNASQRWAVFAPPTYAAAISPAIEDDVVKAVKLAVDNDISLLATGGRHGYTTTFQDLQEGLALDLSQLDSVVVNAEAETVTIGGGTRVGQIFDPVFEAGFELQTITSQCPGMLGPALGGGVGRDNGRYGLMSDALVSAHLVTAEGKLIKVSESCNPDLFWAIKGAGANFGVITEATFALHKLPAEDGYDGQVVSIDLLIPANITEAYFEAVVATFGNTLPPNLASETVMMYNANLSAPVVVANWAYFGPEAEALAILAPLLDLQPIPTISVVPWNELANTFLQGTDPANCPGNRSESVYGLNMRELHAATYQTTFEKLSAMYIEHPEARGIIITVEFFPNQAIIEVPDESASYPWRDSIAYLLVLLIEAGELGEQFGQEIRADFVATSGYDDLTVYVNYAHGDETLEQIYGADKLPRLAALKEEWDPNSVFSWNNGLPTSYP